MTPFAKLRRVSDYLRHLKTDGHTHLFVTDQAHIVKKLTTSSGVVIAKARPELSTDGSLGSYDINTVIFVLHPDLGAGRTDDKEEDLYDSMLETATGIISQLRGSIDGGCTALRGISHGSISLTPTASVFGGWFGWVIDITLQ